MTIFYKLKNDSIQLRADNVNTLYNAFTTHTVLLVNLKKLSSELIKGSSL